VYQATVGESKRLVALKIALKALPPDLRQRWIREAESAQKVNSPHVVTVVDTGADEEIPWVAWEFLDGHNLHEYVEANGRFRIESASAVLRQIFLGIRDLHLKGIVHCDLSPKNVFLARDGAEQRVKLLDFGIAKILGESMAGSTAFVAGSPLWMSPEQMRGREGVAGQTDVWAFGLLAFYIVVGRPYWRSVDNLPAYITQVLHEPRKRASARAAELGVKLEAPEQFDEWFAHCTSLDPAARYQSISEAWRAYQKVYSIGLDATTEQVAGPRAPARSSVGWPFVVIGSGALAFVLGGLHYWRARSDSGDEKARTLTSVTVRLTPSAALALKSAMSAPVPSDASDVGLYAECAAASLFVPARRGSAQVDAFCVDEKEVSVASFRECVQTKACSSDGLRCSRAATWSEPPSDREDYPINCVSYEQAARYCRRRQADLPTSAQWDSIRALTTQLITPNTACLEQTSPCRVASFAGAVNSIEPLNIIGNVAEWTTERNERAQRAIRGGSWINSRHDQFLADPQKGFLTAGSHVDYVGFRCVSVFSPRRGPRTPIPKERWL
jgi:hypothetical protein